MGEGMTLETLQVIIEAQTKPYRDEVEKLKKQTTTAANHVERQTARMKKSFGGLGRIITSVLSIGAIIAFGKSCIDLGSDLAEVQNVVDVTFGKMSGAVNAFSKNAITQFGLSELTAKKYMGTFGAMAKSFGIVGEAGYQMSASITGLTGDVASFYNLSTDEAYTKLKSIFTGETESLKELGVVMTQTALDQYALNNGFGKTTAKMTEQEKVMLRYRFVMSSLSDASGDFARTSQSWANQVRVLSLQFQSLKATIGQGLINVFTPVIRVINAILTKLRTLAAYFKAFTVALFGDAGGSSEIADSMDSAARSSGAVADNMDKAAGAAKKMKEYTLGIDELNVLNPEDGDSGSGGGGDGGGGGGVPDFGDMSGELFGEVTVNPEIEAAVERLRKVIDAIKTLAKPTTDALKRLWNEGLSLLGKFTWTALGDFWKHFLVPLGSWALGEGFPRFIDITNNFLKSVDWDAINEALRNFWKALEPFAEKVGEGLLDFYEDLSKVGAWFINTIVPGGIQALADALDNIDVDEAKQIGYALGVIAASLTAFSFAKAGLTVLQGIPTALPTIGAMGGLVAFAMIIAGIREDLEKIKEVGLPKWQEDNKKNDSSSPWKKYGEDPSKSSGEIASEKNSANPYNKYDEGESWFTKIQEWWNSKGSVPGMDNRSDQMKASTEKLNHWIEEGKKIREQEVKDTEVWWGELETKFNNGIDNIATSIKNWFNNDVAPWFTAEKWSDLYDSVKISLKAKWDETVVVWVTDIQNWWKTHVSPWFTSERWSQLYNNIKVQLKTKWKSTVGEWESNIKNWWNQHVAPWFTAKKWSDLYLTLKTKLKETWNNTVVEWATNIQSWWNQHVSPWFTPKKWFDLYQTVKTKLKETWESTVGEWGSNIKDWWDQHVAPWFTAERWLGLYESVKTSLDTTWKNSKNDWKKNLSDWWKDDVEPWFKLETWIDAMKGIPNAFKDSFNNAVSAARDVLNSFIDKVNALFTFEWDFTNPLTGEEHSGSVTLFEIPHIPAFAAGGFPEDGLFMANHGELVGKFSNGRTAVANNEQITQGIKEAVIEGMSIVMASYSGNSDAIIVETHVDMDGRTIVKQTDKVQNRKGFDFRKPQMT